MYRVENKYCCEEKDLFLLQKRIGIILPSDSHEHDADGYSVTSLYFDDLNDTCFQDTLDGNEIRSKYRIRIYNDSLRRIQLEVKQKRDSRIYKKSKTISEEEMHRLINGRCIDASALASDPAALFNIAICTRGLRPRVIVKYERKAYVFKPGNTRITFDRHVRASNRVNSFGTDSIYYDPIREVDSVLEVKYDEFIPDFILQMLELGKMQQTSYSKYQLCRELY